MRTNVTKSSSKGLIVELSDGTKVPTLGTRIWAASDIWANSKFGTGYNLPDGYKLIDPKNEMDQYLIPTGYQIGSRFVSDNHAALVTHISRAEGPIVYGKIELDGMTPEAWETLNPGANGLNKRASNYEVVAPRDAALLIDDIVRDEDGGRVKASSMMFLGKNGSKGMVVMIPMRPWEREVTEAIGTGVAEYMIVHIAWNGTLKVMNGSNFFVCQNAMIARFGKSQRMLKTGHALGAKDRLAQALTGIWEGALEERDAAQQAILHLLNQPMTENEVHNMVEALYIEPGRPDEGYIGKLSLAERTANWQQRANLVKAQGQMVMAAFTQPEIQQYAGVTAQAQGTAFGALQALTFTQTYTATKSTAASHNHLVEQMVLGGRGQIVRDGVDYLLKTTGYSNN